MTDITNSRKQNKKNNDKELLTKLQLENEELKKQLKSSITQLESKSEYSGFDNLMTPILETLHNIKCEKNEKLNFKLDTINAKCTCDSVTSIDAEFETKKKEQDDKEHQQETQYKHDQEQKEYADSLIDAFNTEYDRLLQKPNDLSLFWKRSTWSFVLSHRCRLKCSARSALLRRSIENSPELLQLGIVINYEKLDRDHHCFKVLLPEGSIIPKISCSVPTDANGNYDITDEEVPKTLETAIMDSDDKLISCEDLGYDGFYLPQFWKDEDLIQEILRVAQIKGKYNARKQGVDIVLKN